MNLLLWIAVAWAGMGGGTDWTLVGAYDLAAIDTLQERKPRFVWNAAVGMSTSCGPAKGADGLRMFEAQAVGSRLTPSLALVLKAEGATAKPLTADQVRVSVGNHIPQVTLQPMVEPRNLAITISSSKETARYEQLVRTQLEVEACLEHKTGRAWMGHRSDRLRQAFLLSDYFSDDRSRKYFGGQQDPVAALLGPPDACIRTGTPVGFRSLGGRGEGRDYLIPTDIWGASLRSCRPVEKQGMFVENPAARLRFRSSAGFARPASPRWQELAITLRLQEGDAPEQERLVVDMAFDGEPIISNTTLFSPPNAAGKRGMQDVLARVPYRYPELQVAGQRYTVLVVPNWQLVEALRRLDAEFNDPGDDFLRRAPLGVIDGVGHLLSHPEQLFVQVRPESDDSNWPNLAGVMRGSLGETYGYTMGTLAARSPIVVPGILHSPSDHQIQVAQRTVAQVAFTSSLMALLVFCSIGLVRIRDLWSRAPEERAGYWPGTGLPTIADTEQNTPEMEGE